MPPMQENRQNAILLEVKPLFCLFNFVSKFFVFILISASLNYVYYVSLQIVDCIFTNFRELVSANILNPNRGALCAPSLCLNSGKVINKDF